MIRTEHPQLQNFKIKAFSKKLAELYPFLWDGDIEEGLKKFSGYKSLVPVRGVALFDKTLTKVLLVQGIESRSWSFPRGKIEQDETDVQAAVREAMEEVGLDVKPYINEKDFIERTVKGKNYKIYLCKNIPDDVAYRPTVRNEIDAINWKNFKSLMKEIRKSQGNYFLVAMMIGQLSKWVKKQRGEIDEESLKSEVEEQLKNMLGIGEEPVNDPGRELLEILRTATAKKQVHDQQVHHVPLPITGFPIYPSFGTPFHPANVQPFSNMHLIAPFAPPVIPHPGMIPEYPFPVGNVLMGPRPPLPAQQQQQQQQPPNIAQLQRPSLVMRNDLGSTELLGLLNKKNEKPTAKKSPLASQNETLSTDRHKDSLLSLLGKSAPKAVEPSASYASKELLGLIKKPTTAEVKSTPLQKSNSKNKPNRSATPLGKQSRPQSPKPQRANSPKPKIKILKREDKSTTPLKTESKQSSSNSKPAKTSSAEGSTTPNAELLRLIQQSREAEDDDTELFEDFTDTEDDLGITPEDKGKVRVPSPEPIKVPSFHKGFEERGTTPPKKFKILKRGEELKAVSPILNEDLIPHTMAGNESIASIIDFSDRSGDEVEAGNSFEGPVELKNDGVSGSQGVTMNGGSSTSDGTETQSKSDLNATNNGRVKESDHTLSSPSDELMGLLRKGTEPKQGKDSVASAELFSMLHKSPDQNQKKATTGDIEQPPKVNKEASNELMSALFSKPAPAPTTPNVIDQYPQTQVEQTPREPGTHASGLMSLLTKTPSSNSASSPAPVLATTSSTTENQDSQSKHSKNLLNLLFKR